MNRATLATALCTALATALGAQDKPSMEIFFGQRPKEFKVAKWGPEKLPSPCYAFTASKLLTGAGAPIDDAVIVTRDSKIVAIGPRRDVTIPDGCQVFDMGDCWIAPGFVDLHCHMMGRNRRDYNDMVNPTNPELRTLDMVSMDHPQVKSALAGGVTTVLFIPGSGTNMGGFGTLTKTAGKFEEALLRFPGSLKIAQAGNPERRSGDLGADKMGMNEGLRRTLDDGYRYYRAWEEFDAGNGPKPKNRPDLEYLRGLFRHEYPVTVHTQIYQVVLETLRELRIEFNLWTVIDHGTFDAYRLCGEAQKVGVPVCNGPRQYHFDRNESRFIGLAHAWYAGGTHGWREPVPGVGRDGIAVNTDSPVIAQEQLTLQCAMACRLGLPYDVAIRAITINPARFVGADHRVGSLEVGKDADLAVWTGDPLDPRHHVKITVVNGRIAYRRDEERPRF
ncbi:MAG: amidohydrolase family protein [Planctomycetes bacterium]|nr:amidohydrolase family protein [Planctomycetota bacterium]